jgi:glutamate synthase (NADPH/NADH) small chain
MAPQERQRPVEQDAVQRRSNFDAVEENFTKEQALAEASRCLNCKNPMCKKGCPVNVNIPDFIQEIKNENFQKAGEIIRQSNMLPSVCEEYVRRKDNAKENVYLELKENLLQ